MEFTIAMLANRGWTNTEIASHLNITVRTVKQHLSSIFNKLNICNRRQLQIYMLK
jgi:DNA-binding NarL/FixJ family response regulator